MATATASATANGEGSSGAAPHEGTLSEVMRAPSNPPGVVVLDRLPDGLEEKEIILDPKEDLWLTTADGRYNSPIIPICVGTEPHQEVFHVHKGVLLKAEWFRKALCGGFMETAAQKIDLPDEDPAIFHFIVAFLYENSYAPTKPLSSVLVPDEDKGKERELDGLDDNNDNSADSDSDSSTTSHGSDSSARSRHQRERHRRRVDRETERLRQKHPGMHRPQCACPQCIVALSPCVSCGFTARLPSPMSVPAGPPVGGPPGGGGAGAAARTHRHRRRGPDGRPLPRAASPPAANSSRFGVGRIKGEDMRTWLLAYELNIDVYICANKFLLDDFKPLIARIVIDMLETAGVDAAETEVLALGVKLYDGVREDDSLLKMVFARLGFLQSTMWQRSPEATNAFLVENPEVAALILKEMAIRSEGVLRAPIPSMERHIHSPPFSMNTTYHTLPPALRLQMQQQQQQLHRFRQMY